MRAIRRLDRTLRWILGGTLGALLFLAAPVRAQTIPPVYDLQASHQFGVNIKFTASMTPDAAVQAANLTIQIDNAPNSIVIPAEMHDGNALSAVYQASETDTLPAFSQLTYWFTLEYADGTRAESEKAGYTYTDNRYTWQTLSEQGRYRVHWVEGDLSFGQALLDALLNARGEYAKYLDLPFPDQLDIYVYPDNLALQNALEMSHVRWAAGHANTDENTILTAIPTGFDQQLDIQRSIPHEITHIRLAIYMGESYDNLPAWYNEGLASLAEQYTAPSYWQILQTAQQKDALIPLAELCRSFPTETSRAGLAYAQSDSFVRYLHTEYGKISLQALVDAYAGGQTCQNGVQSALGTSLDQLEADWYKAAFNRGIIPRSLSEVLVWAVLLIVILAGPISLAIFSARKRKGANSNV